MTKYKIIGVASFLAISIFMSGILFQIQLKSSSKEVLTFDQPRPLSKELPYEKILYTLDQNDTDNDGMPNEWEIENGLDPNTADGTLDYDLDELVNLDEYLYDTDPYNPDTDGDRFNDGVEVQKGTDPNDPNDHPVRIWLIILIIFASGLVLAGLGWLINIMIKVKKGELGEDEESS